MPIKERDSASGPLKTQLSFNLTDRSLDRLRQKAKEAQSSLNEALRSILNDYYDWYQLPDVVVEVLQLDAKKRGREDQRSYIIDLMMKRYRELMVEQEHAEKSKK